MLLPVFEDACASQQWCKGFRDLSAVWTNSSGFDGDRRLVRSVLPSAAIERVPFGRYCIQADRGQGGDEEEEVRQPAGS